MSSEREQQFNDAFHRVISALAHLQRVALQARRASVWAETQQAHYSLLEALEFDETAGKGIKRGRK